MNWYDKQGNPVTIEEWVKLTENNPDYKRVGLDIVGTKRISTVLLGLNHNYYLSGLPLIFETMVFDSDGFDDEECVRYSTEAEALAGHQAIVERYRRKLE